MTKQITVRLPDLVAQFVDSRAALLEETSTAVVVAALQAEMRRCEIERERAILATYGDDDPDLPVMSREQLDEAWKDLDR